MAYGTNLEHCTRVSNSRMLTRISGVYKDNLRADVGLRVRHTPPKGFEFSLFGPAIQSPDGFEEGASYRTATDLFSIVEDCRKKWVHHVLKYSRRLPNEESTTRFEFPFVKRWDFSSEPQILEEIAPQLAVAGNELFKLVFEIKSDKKLKKLSGELRSLMRKSRYISITSSDFFLPWGMIYTHPVGGEQLKSDGSNCRREGFWGYQHIIQHAPEKVEMEVKIPSTSGQVALSVNFDSNLSTELELPATAIDDHVAYMSRLGGSQQITRTKKAELCDDFTIRRGSLERIIYFYCHGTGSTDASNVNLQETHLRMTDDVVTAHDFELWSDDQDLPTTPLVFINACQGGQMTTMFYQTLAAELLKEGAVGLVGAQIDLPAVFAIEYARRLFKRFLKRNQSRIRLGPLIREVNRVLWNAHKNPLGLVYSLYRGADCFIDWQAA
jgi:hypothetical protein